MHRSVVHPLPWDNKDGNDVSTNECYREWDSNCILCGSEEFCVRLTGSEIDVSNS